MGLDGDQLDRVALPRCGPGTSRGVRPSRTGTPSASARPRGTRCGPPVVSTPCWGRRMSRRAGQPSLDVRRRWSVGVGRVPPSSPPQAVRKASAAPPASNGTSGHARSRHRGRTYPRRVTEPPRPVLQFEVDGEPGRGPRRRRVAAGGPAGPPRLRSAKDGCSPQGQCGCCTVLVDGAPRVACVTPARRVAGRRDHDPRGLARRRRRGLGRGVLRHRGQPVRLLHARGSSCGSRVRAGRASTWATRSPWTGRWPPTCAAAPGWRTILDAGPHSSATPCAGAGPRRPRPPGGARGRRTASGSGPRWRWARAASPTTPPRPTRSWPCPTATAAGPSARRSAEARAGGGQGAGPAHDGRARRHPLDAARRATGT